MKKALLALSIAAGLTGAAQAENTTTLYGSLGVEAQIARNAGPLGAVATENRTSYDFRTETAYLGVKGTEDLNNGLQAFYKFEFDFKNDGDADGGLSNTRYAYVGLRGDWGTLTLGKQDSLYKVVTGYNDIFEDAFYSDYNHFGNITGGDRIAKTISYVSPDYSGFQFGIAGILDGSHQVNGNSGTNNFSGAQAGLWYNQNGFFAGLAYSWMSNGGVENIYPTYTSEEASYNVFGANFGYSNDTFKVGFGVETANGPAANGEARNIGQKYNLAGEYYMGPNTFRAGVGFSHTNLTEFANGDDGLGSVFIDKTGDNEKANIWTVALGYQYNFSQRTYSWVEGQYIKFDSDIKKTADLNKLNSGYVVRVGLRHDF